MLAYKDVIGVDEQTALKLISGFGGGFGRMREVCGAVSGMVAVYGAVKGYANADATTEKMDLYKAIQALMKEFKEQNGSYICAELVDDRMRTPRPCALLVGDACEILEKHLSK